MPLKTIMVVDDNDDIRELVSYILCEEGFQIIQFNKGQGVEQEARLRLPNLILLDLMLEDADGRDIRRSLKDSPLTSHIPILIVSATHGWHTEYEKHCGANDYLQKPFGIDLLLSSVRRYC